MFKVSTTYLNKEVNFETFGDAVDFRMEHRRGVRICQFYKNMKK